MSFWIAVIWGLFPLTLLLLWIWAILKPFFKVPGKERPSEYFNQFIFSAVTFAIAIAIDLKIYPQLSESFGLAEIDQGFSEILIYPAVLLIIATIHSSVVDKKKKKDPTQQIGARIVR